MFRDASLKRKLTVIIMVTSSAALLVATACVLINDAVTLRRTTAAELRTLGRVIGANCTAALTFDDANSAGETLAALKARPAVVFACIYGKDGAVFATYRRSDWPTQY